MINPSNRSRWLIQAGVVVLLAALFLPVAATGQNPPPPPPTSQAPQTTEPPQPQPGDTSQPNGDQQNETIIRVLSNMVIAPVTVVDPSGEFLYELKETDFELLDNGKPQKILNFESEPRPIALVIVVQTSRSVEALLEPVRFLGSVFSSLLLGAQGQAAVITYSDRVKVAQDFSGDSDILANTLRKITPEGVGGSRLNDAIMRAVALLERRHRTERRIAVVFADGFDGGSETDSKEVIRRSTGSEVTIYGMGFSPTKGLLARKPEVGAPGPQDQNIARPLPPGVAPTPTASANVYQAPIPAIDIVDAAGKVVRSTVFSNLLEHYAGYTGGVYYSHWKDKDVEDQISRIASEVQSQYELAYVPDTSEEGGFHRIQVKVHRQGVKVRARAGYFYQVAVPASKPEGGEPGEAAPQKPGAR